MRRSALIILENLPAPFDRRTWQQARTLQQAGWTVSIICPKGWTYTRSYECLEGIHIYRHPLPLEAAGLGGYLIEYTTALFWELVLSLRVLRRHGFDVIQACNPPDLIFLIGAFYKILFGKRFVYDHRDISPELFEAKFGRRRFLHRVLLLLERCTFRTADASLATNESFRQIAIDRGGMPPDRVWVVKGYPELNRFHRVPADPALRRGFRHLIGYVGVMGSQDGVDHLVHAMAHIVYSRGRRDVGCLIIGNGPELAGLQRLARALDVTSQIEFTGFLTGQPLLRHLSSIDVGVIPDPPNVYNDKISMNKVFEYMTLGIPFVQFDVTEGRRTAGDAAKIAPVADGASLGDTLLNLLNDEPRRRAMAQIGLERAKSEFRWEDQQRAMLAAFEAAVAARYPGAKPKRATEDAAT